MINYNEINDFIIKVFNYYNGRINIINKAVLDINWANLEDQSIQGYSVMPNIVCIYPMVIYRLYNEDIYNTKAAIIETIIHELYHIDQAVDYTLYTFNFNYNKSIEHACQLQTVIYIAWHTEEIYNIFGILFDIEYYKQAIDHWYYPGANYKRRYFIDHLIMYLDVICDLHDNFGKQLLQYVFYCISNGKNIVMDINGNTIPVCVNGEAIPIDDFNKKVYPFKYKNNRCNYDINFDINEDGNLSISVIVQSIISMCDTIMCKKV